MPEATQNATAIGELLLAGTLLEEKFAAFIEDYSSILPSPSPDASVFMLLETLPRHVIEAHERQDLLCFALFDASVDFTSYTSGRIFHPLGELRWERQHPNVQIVYTGHEHYRPQLQAAKETALDARRFKDREYFLFGKRLDEKQLDRIGSAGQRGDFAEVRIPRLLRYPPLPTLADAERIQLVIREYRDATTSVNIAYRFKNLVPFSKQQKIGAK